MRHLITITGYVLCLFLAELSAMMPDRAGGSPSYAYPAYKDRWPRFAEHVNGFTAWAYWLGWFPVAPLNMILASFYIVDRFKLNATSGFTPIHTFIAVDEVRRARDGGLVRDHLFLRWPDVRVLLV
ncbi:MAG: amino acid permease [Solirubrobacteraceae bacterium]